MNGDDTREWELSSAGRRQVREQHGDDFNKLLRELQDLNSKLAANTARMDFIDAEHRRIDERWHSLNNEHTALMEKGHTLEAAVERVFARAKDRLNAVQLHQLYLEDAER